MVWGFFGCPKYGITGVKVKYYQLLFFLQSCHEIVSKLFYAIYIFIAKKSGEEGYDRLYKIRPLLDYLVAVYPLYYQAAQHVSVDEMMIGTRCRVSFLQYMPKKPTKFGIKVWVLAEAKTGYVLSLQVYSGAEKGSEKGLGKRVVMDLMHPYQGKNHLYMSITFTRVQVY